MTSRRPPESRRSIARAVAGRFETPFLRHYAEAKIRADPLYEAVAERLPDGLPVLDVGCGAGLMALYLRQSGFRGPIAGIDHDERKIVAARTAATGIDPPVHFLCADAMDLPEHSGSILLLDVLQYLSGEEQRRLLNQVTLRVARGGVAIVRQGINDGSWRYRATLAGEAVSRAVRWRKTQPLRFPATEEIRAPFEGFEISVEPAYGATPFNNYLFVFRR